MISPTRTAYIASLKYAPGLAKEYSLIGRQLVTRGWRVVYLLSEGYRDTSGFGGDIVYLGSGRTVGDVLRETARFPFSTARMLRDRFSQQPPALLLMYNPHPANAWLAALAETGHPAGRRALFVHEPFTERKRTYGAAKALYIACHELLQAATVRRLTDVLVASPYASRLFERRFPRFAGSVHLTPLLLPAQAPPPDTRRHYLALVGTLNRARSADDFLRLEQVAAARGFRAVKFCLATGSRTTMPATSRIRHLKPGRPLSDADIANVVSRSMGIFLPHSEAVQSGNVPLAFSLGTPVMARDIPGLTQHVVDGRTGVVFPEHPSDDDLFHALERLVHGFPDLSRNALMAFRETFSEDLWSECYGWLE